MQAESKLEAEGILRTARGSQDSSKPAAADTWVGKEQGSAEGSDETWVWMGEANEQSWV
jgi:hypothetical protein